MKTLRVWVHLDDLEDAKNGMRFEAAWRPLNDHLEMIVDCEYLVGINREDKVVYLEIPQETKTKLDPEEFARSLFKSLSTYSV